MVTDSPERRAARALGSSFLPVPGSKPVSMEANLGCKFPVYPEVMEPLSSPTATLFCGRQRAWTGQALGSYCRHHQRLSYRPRAS